MKTLILLAAGFITIHSASAQKLNESQVPEKVKQAFSEKYPGAKAKWEKEGENYEAGFDLNKVESSAEFDAQGAFKELEQEIKITELPKAAAEYCNKNFKDFKLDEASKITAADGKISFEAEMKKGKEHFDAIFDAEGTFIKRSALLVKD